VSGIAGILVRKGERPATATEIQRMIARMRHRARDGNSWWIGADAVLGHALLQTTIEPGAGLVEMAGGKLVITSNSRLDEREELLARLGNRNRTLSDAALILHAYLRWGEACPEYLQGDFAFAIWDEERRSLFCARDHFGVRPFYYCSTNSRFVFASEIGPILEIGSGSHRLSESQISGFLAGLPDDPQSTPYQDVFRLPERHSLTVTEKGVQLRRYWSIEPSQRPMRSDAAEEFGHLFETSVRNRVSGAPAVGAMLSGGIDSSSICCVAGRLGEGARKLPTFSLVFGKGSAMDEQPFIESVLAQGRFDSNLIPVANYAPFAEFDRVLQEQESTFLAPGLGLTRSLYRAAEARGVRVLLDGHGGDEVVSQGYGRLHELADARQWLELWRQLQGAANTFGENKFELFFRFLTIYGPAWRVAKIRGVANRVLHKVLGRPAPVARPGWSGLINRDFAARTDLADRFHRSGGMPRSVAANEALSHRWILSSGQVSHAFEVLDKAAANFGVEPRYPFWDKPLVEFCLALPAKEKLDNGFGRYVLRRAMDGILPPMVQWRRDKIDFKASLVGGMIGHHRGLLDKVLGSDAGRIAPYVDLDEVKSAYNRLLEKPVEASLLDAQYVWRSVSLSLWLRQFQTAEAPA
jgi:asparagine synthase (glutamine-hydrolysing)